MRDNFYSMHRTRLEEKLGADVVEDLDFWVRGIVSSESVTKDQFGQIISNIDQRFDSLHQRFDSFRSEMEQRFDSFRSEMEQRFDSFRSDIDQRLDAINERIVSSIKWTVGTIALFGTIITVLMAVFKFFP